MYRIVLGKVSTLSAAPLPPALRDQAPQGPRRERWLAGRALLSHTLSPLPEIIYGEQGKPAFAPETPLWFNLSHSGDDIALLLSDEGEVGCDIEVIRPRANWRWLANAVFSLGNTLRWTPCIPISNWKCSGASGRAKKPSLNSVWQRLANRQRRQHLSLITVSQPLSARKFKPGDLHPYPFTLSADSVQWIDSVN